MNTNQLLDTVALNSTRVDLAFWILSTLQAERQKTYQNSWCRRGELYSIYPNTARKFDRLLLLLEKPEQFSVVTAIDTIVDFGVYVGLWLTYDRKLQAPSTTLQFQNLLGEFRSDVVQNHPTMRFSDLLQNNIVNIFQSTVELYMDKQQRILSGKPDRDPEINEAFLYGSLVLLFINTLSVLQSVLMCAPSFVLFWAQPNLDALQVQELYLKLKKEELL